jgi:hypothetical protein
METDSKRLLIPGLGCKAQPPPSRTLPVVETSDPNTNLKFSFIQQIANVGTDDESSNENDKINSAFRTAVPLNVRQRQNQ